MNIKKPVVKNQKPIKDEAVVITLKQPNLMDIEDDEDDVISISNVVRALNSVDPNAPDSAKNAHSISDNNGGRIELNLDKVIKK